MKRPFQLTVKSRVRWRSEGYEVTALGRESYALRRLRDGARLEIERETLLSADDFASLDASTEPPETALPVTVLLDLVPPDELKLAERRLEELREAETGYRSGTQAEGEPDEPRPQYDPEKVPSLQRRFEAKAAELSALRDWPDCSVRTLYRWRRDYRDQWLWGLVDKRHCQLNGGLGAVDERYLSVLRETLDAQTEKSNLDAMAVRIDVKRTLQQRFGKDVVPIPGRTSYYELYNKLARHRSLTNARRRRSNAGRPAPNPMPLTATYPGEIVQIDCTRPDILILDPATGYSGRPEIAIAVDAFSHTFLGARVDLVSQKGVDAALLLHDVVTPKAADSGWPERGRWNYAGVPREIVAQVGEPDLRGAEPAAIPFCNPGTAVVDHGKIFMSRCFFAGCHLLQTNLQPAPPLTPNYKAVIERFIRTLKQILQHAQGYTGSNVLERGLEPDPVTLLYPSELERLLLDWLATSYHHTPHAGCRLSGTGVAVSPMRKFEEGIERAGFIMAMPNPYRVLELLPIEWRVIRPERGVEIDIMRYWGDVLEDWLNEEPPYDRDDEKFPFRVDPRDRSRIWFQDPYEKSWHALFRKGAGRPDPPFQADLIPWVKRQLVQRGEDSTDRDAFEDMLIEVLDRHEIPTRLEAPERRMLARSLHAQEAVERDHAAHGVGAEQREEEAPSMDARPADAGWEETVDPLGVIEWPQ